MFEPQLRFVPAYSEDIYIEPEKVFCVHCNEWIPESGAVSIGGQWVCKDCLRDYCEGLVDEFAESYLESNSEEYLSGTSMPDDESLFYNWWLSELQKTDRLRILKDAYTREKQDKGMAYNPDWEKDFCVESDDWEDFVREKLC